MTTSRTRKGFTLVEITVVVVLGGLVLGALLQVLMTNQRTYTAQSAAVQGQQTSRMAIEVMFNELRELSPGDGDIRSMSPSVLDVRLMRKFGIACEVDVGPLALVKTVTVLDNTGDDFAANDTVFVFAENREATGSDDVWLVAPVTGVDTTVTCLGRPAIELQFPTLTTVFDTDSVRVGAPVRAYRNYTYQRVNLTIGTTSGTYLSRRDPLVNSGFPWPIAGPLRPGTDGVQFIYRDAMGNITSTPTDVRQIEVRIRTGNRVMSGTGQMVSDSLSTWIYTRN